MRKIRSTIFFLICVFSFQVCYCRQPVFKKVKKVLEKNILKKANESLKLEPITITTARSQSSAGGLHDFFSEGDYWWPNPEDINGAYIQKDGLTNPQNFVEHRKAMIRLSQIVGTLTSAYIITKNEKYATQAFKHLRACFIDTATLMNPSMLYAQAIKGKVTAKGNLTTKSDCRFEHKFPLPGTNYYRLKQIDVNGGFTYSDIKKVVFKKANLLLKNNVVANELEIIVTTPTIVNVFSAAGAKLLTINIKEKQKINLNNYKTRIYFLKTEFGDTASFFKQ